MNFRQPPKFENPDQAFDDKANEEEEELEREQNAKFGDGGDKDFDDDYGQKQFEHDMRMGDHERMNAPKEGGEPILNQRGAGHRARQFDPGVEEAMRHEINENDFHKRAVVKEMEQKQKDELEKR